MYNFFGRRELLSFCVSEKNHKLLKKEDFVLKQRIVSDDAERESERLPNGELFRLKGSISDKGTHIDDSTIFTEYEYKRGALHGKYRAKKEIRDRTCEVEGEFQKGKPHGTFVFYEGKKFSESCVFVDGRAFESSLDTLSKETTIFCRNKNREEEYHITRTKEFGISPYVIRIEEEKVVGLDVVETRKREFSETEEVVDETRKANADSRGSFEIFFFSRGYPEQ
ncbi:hypothetical protein A9K97_gp302 [Tokyovirus A1]|uniref:hypothetical protein n=1 Tax=Tokyovirus A1 TaxID=1826170 RepID=UPI0007A982E1|nr:hypothetical protein A9K97_gp302 [Tokyovirus A1]BAU80049.1 conserved hypothetical protein [Tokyovirus A1]